jgi:RNA polymerase sigma-70 factor (ECF subfamily)
MMDAAFENPFDHRRLHQHTGSRRGAMAKSLTEREFSRAVSDGLPQLIAVARRLAGNEDLAAEAVQNALLKASKSRSRFRGESHVDTWLTRIVIHAVRDAIAAQHRRTHQTTSIRQAESERETKNMPDPGDGPGQRVLDEEFRRIAQVAVGQLPDRQREVFSLMIWQGMTARQVGTLLDISAQTVHANLHAARKRLREVLQQYVGDDRDQSL